MRRGLQSIIIIGAFIAFYYFGFGIFGSTAGTIISIFSTLTVISISLAIFMENRNPSTTMSWILLLALIPVLGLVFYFLFGQNVFKRRKYDKKAQRDLMAYERIENDALRTHQDWSVFDPRAKNCCYYPRLWHVLLFPLHQRRASLPMVKRRLGHYC